MSGEPAGGRGSGRCPVPSPAIEQNLIRGKARGLGKLSYVAELAGRDRAGAAAGLSHIASALGGLIGPPLFGLMVDWSGSYALGFYGLITLEVAAIVVLTRIAGEDRPP